MQITNAPFQSTFHSEDETEFEDHSQLNLVIKAAKAFASSVHQGIYVFDCLEKQFLYTSDNMSHLCGQSIEKLHKSSRYLGHIPEEERDILLEICERGKELFSKIPASERLQYTLSYDLHLGNEKKIRLMHHKLTPILLTDQGEIRVVACTMMLSSQEECGHIKMKKIGENRCYEYSLEKHKWEKNVNIELTDIERELLSLSVQGYTVNGIAEKMYRSVDSIKSYKKVLFAKLEVKNIAEAISYAANNQLLL
jgi:DNA-binding CsgD family transcriptional regulator